MTVTTQTSHNPRIIVHADDFGLSLEQSITILACSTACGGEGALNSTSMMVGSPAFEECAALVRPHVEAGNILLGLHLNLVEGPCCAPADEVPLLVGEDGMFKLGFASLLKESAGRNRAELKRQLVCEITAQVERFCEAFPALRSCFRVDGHQHFHLIPLVFEALGEALAACNVRVEYLRIPTEPLAPFFALPRKQLTYPPVNLVKNALLNALWHQCRPHLSAFTGMDGKPITIEENSAVFYGLVLSGCMENALGPGLLNRMLAVGKKQGRSTELLFHPGGMQAKDCLNPNLEGFVAFYESPHRALEAQAVVKLESLL